ncbi:GSU3473 family protein [Geobacter anodireducens]|uniref:Uncharacterized protein n=1 Tax=Geobacter soli TaxID=1510391 RepID=A0A0C1TNB7_9BACT|nr:hypothetical protein [Geobacter soli]ANA40375.1 hypothetical protein A2G06_08795 [Geobacter anodireducens]KIE42379.1 hypothetical protein SE37_06940 [Geobacter soli]HMN01330.1 hypothetical protein [Geobacter anodireducens]
MVVLVRCIDDTITVALEAHLKQLIREGSITSFLRAGEWVDAVASPERKKRPAALNKARYVTLISGF